MKFNLSGQTKVQEIQKLFSVKFHFLKIEFYKEGHTMQNGSSGLEKVPGSYILKNVSNHFREGVFIFDETVTVGWFEQTLQEKFGLPVQVFRRSDDEWIETTYTDVLSLERQNELGRETMDNGIPISLVNKL